MTDEENEPIDQQDDETEVEPVKSSEGFFPTSCTMGENNPVVSITQSH